MVADMTLFKMVLISYVSLNPLLGKRKQTSFQKLWFYPFFGLDILGYSECCGPYPIMILKARG